ncbi:MAG: hypothetical protein IPI40_00335 [Betaproteobacteria bacterium]|nr:hypothetical protein [Betaproteobacteria bacterium]
MSVVLLFADTRYRYLEQLRQVAAVLHPVQQVALCPSAALAQVGAYFASQRSLEVDERAAQAKARRARRSPPRATPACGRRTSACAHCSTSRAAMGRGSGGRGALFRP